MPTKLTFSMACIYMYCISVISHRDTTKRPSGNEPELPLAEARWAKRGGGRRAELVPVLERLRVSERGRTESPSPEHESVSVLLLPPVPSSQSRNRSFP